MLAVQQVTNCQHPACYSRKYKWGSAAPSSQPYCLITNWQQSTAPTMWDAVRVCWYYALHLKCDHAFGELALPWGWALGQKFQMQVVQISVAPFWNLGWNTSMSRGRKPLSKGLILLSSYFIGDGMNAYVAYRVSTQVCLPVGRKCAFTSHFFPNEDSQIFSILECLL